MTTPKKEVKGKQKLYEFIMVVCKECNRENEFGHCLFCDRKLRHDPIMKL